jgi:hypothetical protein
MTTRSRLVALLLLPLAGACEHSRPIEPGTVELAPPLGGPPPVRLTFNIESEWNPVFTRDGSGVFYSFAVPGRIDRDRCLGLLPAAGGTHRSELCWRGGADLDSVDVVVTGAESPSGRLSFVADRGSRRSNYPDARALLVGPPHDPESAELVVGFPGQGGNTIFVWDGAGDLTWLDDSTLVFVALRYGYSGGATNAPPLDTTITGIEVVKLDLRRDPPGIRVYPLTRYASSVAAGPGPGTVIFTAGGDSRVFTLNLATGAAGLLYDFGALGIARDARLVGGKLVAVVGGFVSYGYETQFAMDVQRDQGGPLYSVDLLGAAVPILLTASSDLFFRHVTLNPAGTVAVAEGYRLTVVPRLGFSDTTVSQVSDLYRVPVP